MDDERQRALAFNLSFILLTRIRFIYDDLVSNFHLHYMPERISVFDIHIVSYLSFKTILY